jgi:rhodanese-related sulfurtransferase
MAAMAKWLMMGMVFSTLFLLVPARALAEDALPPREAAAWIKEKKNLQIVDVRTEAEYADGHLDGAKLVPVQEIENRLSEIDQRRPVLLYCRSGHRSARALGILQDHGYTGAKHLAGGIIAWKAAGLQVAK